MSNNYIWIGFRSSKHNNIRYEELLPRLTKVNRIEVPLLEYRVIGVCEYHLFRLIIFPAVCLLLSLKYSKMLCTDPLYIHFFNGKIVVDLDDPTFKSEEVNLLNNDNVKTIITSTQLIQKKLQKAGVHKKIYVIPQGVNVDKIIPRGPKITPSHIKGDLILGIGQPWIHFNDKSLPPEYDLSSLKVIMARVWDVYPNVQLWLVGRVTNSVASWARGKKVRLIGYVPHAKILDCFVNFDIALYPRIVDFKGRLSIKILEYLACGIPVVSTNVGEAYMVKESKGGLIADSNEDFAKKILLLIENYKLLYKLGKNGRRYGAKFTWDKLVIKYDFLLRNSINE